MGGLLKIGKAILHATLNDKMLPRGPVSVCDGQYIW